jgi:hypothetical protein
MDSSCSKVAYQFANKLNSPSFGCFGDLFPNSWEWFEHGAFGVAEFWLAICLDPDPKGSNWPHAGIDCLGF